MNKKYLRLRSRHPSHSFLRRNKELLFNKRVYLKLGSTTAIKYRPDQIILNNDEAIKTSSNKLSMKKAFIDNDISTPVFYTYDVESGYFARKANKDEMYGMEGLNFPIISKSKYGSRGLGNKKHDTVDELNAFIQDNKDRINNYIFEEYCNYSREYRVHVSTLGCYHIVRKLRRNDAKKRWVFNNQTCVWVLPENKSFNAPDTLEDIYEECIKTRKAVGLDIGAIDVRVSKKGDFSILEINSAPCLTGNVIASKFINEIKKIIKQCVD